MKCVLKDSVSRTLKSQRLVNGIDSRVVLGCWGKGRSSSNKLNAVARSCIGWAVLGRKRLVNFWLASGDNFSDEPSRFKVLRARVFMPEVPRRLFVPERTPCRTACRGARGSPKICLQVFAGCGRLSVALEAAGMQTGPPLDAYPNGEKVRKIGFIWPTMTYKMKLVLVDCWPKFDLACIITFISACLAGIGVY